MKLEDKTFLFGLLLGAVIGGGCVGLGAELLSSREPAREVTTREIVHLAAGFLRAEADALERNVKEKETSGK